MPGIHDNTLTRRTFLKETTLASAGALLFSYNPLYADQSKASEWHLALLSDTHIPADPLNEYRGFRPAENLARIVPELVAAKPEGVILNGDAARLTGEIGDYQALKKNLDPIADIAPIYIGLGNHDHRDNFHKVMKVSHAEKQAVRKKHILAIEHPTTRVLVLDSLLYVNKVAGLLGKSQRAWLAQYLDTDDDRPIVLFIHHTLDDSDGALLDVDRLFKLLSPSGKVKAIFYGHSHRYEYSIRENIHLINLPAVGYNFNDKQPLGWLDSKFHAKGVDLTMRAFAGNLSQNGKTTKLTWM